MLLKASMPEDDVEQPLLIRSVVQLHSCLVRITLNGRWDFATSLHSNNILLLCLQKGSDIPMYYEAIRTDCFIHMFKYTYIYSCRLKSI